MSLFFFWHLLLAQFSFIFILLFFSTGNVLSSVAHSWNRLLRCWCSWTCLLKERGKSPTVPEGSVCSFRLLPEREPCGFNPPCSPLNEERSQFSRLMEEASLERRPASRMSRHFFQTKWSPRHQRGPHWPALQMSRDLFGGCSQVLSTWSSSLRSIYNPTLFSVKETESKKVGISLNPLADKEKSDYQDDFFCWS